MSAPSWLNDVHPLPNEDGPFNAQADPIALMHMNSAAAPFDYNVIQNQQYQQRMQNGSDPRNRSPAFQSPMYQTQPVVPTKRPRPREDSIGASPRQAPGMLPPSRSQTPQQGPYTGFQGAINGTQNFQTPNPYHRFSNAGSNASLSPSIQSQQFNPQVVPPRVQTVSPSPFSPATQNFGSQASPPPPPSQTEHGSRVNTPQNGGPSYIQGTPYGGGPNQTFTPPVNPNGVSTHSSQNLQQQQQQRMQELRQRQYMQQMQANNAAVQNRYPGLGINPSLNPSNSMPGMAAMGGRMQHPQQTSMRPNPHEQFVRSVAPWMQMRGLPFNPHPTAAGRPVNLMQLFTLVIKFGGSKAVAARSQWPTVAQHLQVPPAQLMMAAEEIRNYWQTNMLHYESSYLQNQQQRQRAMQEQARMQRPPPNGDISSAQDPYSPLKQMNAHVQEAQQARISASHTPNQNGQQIPSKHSIHQQPDPRAAQLNGYMTPNHGLIDTRHPSVHSRQGSQLPNAPYLSPSQPEMIQIEATKVVKKTKLKTQEEDEYPTRATPREEKYSPTKDSFAGESTLERHGGIHVGKVKSLGDQLASSRPSFPLYEELGLIDIRALTLSLKSGIRGEVRLALDTLCVLSLEMELDLSQCDDLVNALIECAEDQVELLAENTVEVSDAMLINSYEDNLRGARAENEAFQLPPEYGSLEYDLERATDRLICVTTTLRNLSSSELNCQVLATSTVITLMANVMRYLGTRNMLLRTYRNTIDFTKDVVVYLSNVSQHIDLPGREEAHCILHFLLSLAPGPPPTNTSHDELVFPPYDPSLHGLLPHAIDSFAKLLAKDEPNRSFFRSIFYADGSFSPPYELLTKAFGFAIAVLPKYEPDRTRRELLRQVIHARGPYVAQGLLAAEIIVGLIPASEHSLSRAWFTSQDGFAANLIQMVLFFSAIPPQVLNLHLPPDTRSQEVEELYSMISYRGIAVLRKLAERTKDAESDQTATLWGILPGKDSLLNVLKKAHIETGLLQQIYSYATSEL
ncbi:MAG: hypothetical protein L6R41_003317 [Letrouitia leprolyta]|nr:MAG: hypothetical protein L6R41_003317 [Letrouitia leprolyta]